MITAGGIVLAIGLVAVGVGTWFNLATANDGTGANFGAAGLILLGVVVGAAGGMILAAAGVAGLLARRRR